MNSNKIYQCLNKHKKICEKRYKLVKNDQIILEFECMSL